MSTGPCGVACTPSTCTSPPTWCARSAIARTSGRVPTALLAAVTATSRVRRVISSSYCQTGSSQVSMSTSAQRTTAPADFAATSQGRTFASWSSRLTTTSSPTFHVLARARASWYVIVVMFGPRITPPGSPPTRSANARRAASTSASARAEDGNGPCRLDSGTRSVAETARATLSGISVPAGPSRWM